MLRSDEMRSRPVPEPDGEVQLRRMQGRDLDQVLVIERAFAAPWTREMFHQELTQSEVSENWVAEIGACVVGYVLWWYVVDEVHIVNLAVHDAFRRRGVARRLLGALFERARGRGMSIATLEVRTHN